MYLIRLFICTSFVELESYGAEIKFHIHVVIAPTNAVSNFRTLADDAFICTNGDRKFSTASQLQVDTI